jgi:two-component system alkaline phosphatase synthesis response regulator PhoP
MNSSPQTRAVIMVIDGNPDVAAGVTAALSAAGYLAHGCGDAEDALAALRHTKPHLIIADVNLRGVGGVQLCDRIRRRDGFADVAVMFLSAIQSPDIIRRSFAGGAAYYLRKPFDPDVLVELVEKVLARTATPGISAPIAIEAIANRPTELLCGGL